MKIIYTKWILTKITTPVTKVFEKLFAFIVSFLSSKESFTINDIVTNDTPVTGIDAAGCNNTDLYTNQNISNDAGQCLASFSTELVEVSRTCQSEPVEVCHTEPAEGKSFLHRLQIVMKFFTNVLTPFSKGPFKSVIFNKQHTPQELQLVPVHIQQTNTLPVNKHAMRNFTPTTFPRANGVNKNSTMKIFLRKSGIFTIALLMANLFLLSNSFGQTVITYDGPTTNGAAPATYTFITPAGVTSITVECWSGGGAGGGVTDYFTYAGGGAGGSYAKGTFPAGTYNISVGSGGAGVSNGNGGNGGATFFGSVSTLFVPGANGGKSGNGGGGAASNTGIINSGTSTNNIYGAAGGGSGNGNGSGGAGANGGAGGAARTSNGDGNDGTIAGGGGSGGYDGFSSSNRTGGNGAAGLVKITYSCPLPAAPGTITGSAIACAGASSTYSIAAVSGATSYTWAVPTGWNITSGQGTTSIIVTAGSAGQNGNISVVASNVCGSAISSTNSTINIKPAVGTNNTGYTDGTTKKSDGISVTSDGLEGYLKFPLTAIPSGSVISSSTLSLTNNNSNTSNQTNYVRGLGSIDPVTASASTLFNDIANGTEYSATSWSITGTITLTLNSSATSDIQTALSSQGYIPLGLVRGASNQYNFYGYSGGANAPILSVTYKGPASSSKTVTVSASPTITLGTIPAICEGSAMFNIPYTNTSGSPNRYSISGTGITTVTNGTLTGTSGNIIVNLSTAANGSSIPFTLTVNNSTTTCVSSNANGSVTVNAIPTVTAPASPQFYCSNTATSAIVLTGTPSGVVFDITGGSAVGLSNQTGVTSIPSFTTTTGPVFATITITPRANGCTGTTVTYNVIVSPVPTVTSVTGPSPICVGAAQNYTAAFGGGSGAWSSSNGAVATVDPTSGDVTAVSAGTADIIFTINGSCGNPSASQQVIVYDAPGIATQPLNQTVTYGDASVSFTVVPEAVDVSHPAPTYQWQMSTGSGFTDISGETSPTLTIANPTLAMSGYNYHVILTNSCFSATSNDVSLTVNPLNVTVTADAGQTKVYGAADPAAYTYTSLPAVGSSLANGDVISFTGSLSRTPGEAVGNVYAIGQNDLTNSNYNIVYNADNFAITPLTVTVTADAGQAKVYGAADPAYTYTALPAVGATLANGDVISFAGALSRASGEAVGNAYAIGQNDLANSNYNIVYNADNFAITQLSVTVTADAGQTKVYGATDPAAYTYTASPAVGSTLANGDLISFTGALSRASGEAVGTYAIGQNDLANSNYNIVYNADNFAITQLSVTVTADAFQTKVYGDADPAVYSYTSLPAVGSPLANGDVISFSGALDRASGEAVGTYAIGQNDLANSNYNIVYNADNFAITQLTVAVTADAGQTKVYGDADPAAYTYTSSPVVGSTLANGDVISFTGALSRASGEAVTNAYAIGQNTLANSNYNIVYNADNFAITQLSVTVIADAGQAKVYGSADPAYTYTASPAVGSSLANGDVISFTGALSRASGEAVGNVYVIGQNDLANSNYNIVYNADNFAITQLTVTVTADAGQTKVYGAADPAAYSYTASPAVGSSLANGDVISFTGALSRASGEAVDTYAIGQNDLANNNYNIVYNADNFSITQLSVTVTTDAGQTKVYGAADPAAYTYTASPAVGSSLANGDVISFTGALSRASGEAVGNAYAIGQNDLANSNYNIVYNADNFAITQLTVSVTADAGQAKVYGDADPATYSYNSSPAVGSSLTNGDVISFTGALSRISGESVGTYAIGQNDLANSNYNIVYNSDNFAITQLTVTVTADAGQAKVYGAADPAAYTYTASPAVGSTLANGEVISFTGALSRTSGEDVGSYAIGQNDLGNNNYNIVYNADNFSITQLTVTVTADAGQTKVYGDADPTFTYTVSPALISGDSFTGALDRGPGEAAGTYAITLGTLALNGNYNPINYTGADFTITNIPITASATAGIVPCVGGTSILTVTASGGDGILQYSIDGGITFQPGNTFTVNAVGSPYVVTVQDADGFTETTNSVTVTEEPSPTISLSSGAESDDQAICIGNSIVDITYSIGGNTTGATVTALPSGVTGSFSGGVFTITGTPAAPGSYPYTVTTTGPCVNVSLSGNILVNDNATISLTTIVGTDGQTVCINTPIDNITYAIGGGATDATVAGLPNGVTGIYNAGIFTISGTPTVSGVFNYIVATAGPCDIPTATGTITVNGNSSIDLSSANETTAQTVCINNAIADIVYAIDDGATGGVVTGLPNGVTGNYIAGVFTITGTPLESGTFNYTVTTEGPCTNLSLGGTITVNANSTITLSATGTDGQTVCINDAINDINYTVGGGATGASITAGTLPDGVSGSFSGSVFTITGTPTESGNFSYTVTTTGPCINISLSGTITVNANSTINLSSAIGTEGQSVCINNAITAITYTTGGGATSASITAGTLPAGVTGIFNAGVFTISGIPTESGTFPYTVTTDGPCTNVSLSGTITVNADATISLSSGPGTQSVCINNDIITVAYTAGASATNISITAGGLPNGVTGSFSGGVFTISGIPTESGIFNYTVTTAGPCANPSLNGTITVNPSPVVNLVSNASYCNNSAGAAISFSTSTPGTATYNWTSTADVGFGTFGTGSITAFTATNNSNSVVTATVSVTATINGCPGAPTTFNVTVNPSPVMNPVSNLNYCNNGAGGGINFSSPVTGGTVTYNWASSVNVGFGLNGNGNIGSFTAVNNSFNPLIATVTVTPSLNGCSGTPFTFTVTVNPNANAGTISGPSTICTTAQLSTNGSAGGQWTSSTPSIASVDPNSGLVTAGSTTGSATIFYTVNNICGASSSSFTISVNPTAVAGTVSGPTAVCTGSSILLSTNGNSGGTWFSSSTAIATINSSGLVTGVSAGNATIFYYVVNSCGTSISAPYTVSVSAGANPGAIIGSPSICAGSATLLFTTGSSGGTWASANPAVAIVDGISGFVIAQSAGTTTISYTVPSNSCSSGLQVTYFTLTVNPAGNAGTITGNSNICAGTSTLLNTTGSTGGTWLSGNTLIATVDPNTGLVTGVASGAVLITYHVSNSCGTANATFPVIVSSGAVAGAISGSSSVCAGSAISLTSNGTPGGSWTSSNPAAAQVDANGVVLGTGAGNATITYTVTSLCSSSSTSKTINVNALPDAGSVSGASTVCAGLSTPFITNGNIGGTWSSSNPAAATVNSASGVVTAVAGGNSTITYTVTSVCATVSASAPVTVNPVLNAGTISGGSSLCAGGATINLSASGNTSGTWTSSNAGVASVDGSGIVTSVSPGNTTITYTLSNSCGTSNATQLVTVNALANAGTVSGAATLCSGLSTTFATTGTGGTWSSSNTAVATVNATSGLVTGVGAGDATITYTVTSGCGNALTSALITVTSLADAGTISGPGAVCVGTSINLSSGISGGTWNSTSANATVNSLGKVTGVAAGTATITYTVTTTCGTNMASYTVTVNAAPNAGMISGAISSVCVGSSVFLSHVGGMIGGVWKSVNPARASVDPVTGEVTGVSAGNTIIVYSVTNSCGTSTANLPITVNSLPNAGVISGLTSVCAGASINMSASGDANGTWTSTNPGVASVNSNTGVVTGVAQGTTTIIYTVGSAAVCGTSSATYTVSVNPLANAGTISGTTTVCAGLSTTLTSDGSVGGTWASSNSAVASVNSTSGVVIGVAAGSATINYTVTNICGSTTASVPVTVNPSANAGTISGATSVCAGSTINLSSNVSGGNWSSSTHSVATIGLNTGIVTGIGVGNTTITYTVTTSCGTASTTYAITVNPLPNAGTLSGTTYLCTGSTTTLSSNTGGGTWSSSNTSTATVNATTGVVTGFAAGTSTIIYTVSSVCGTATQSAIVTVGALPNAGSVTGATILCSNSTAIFTSNGTGGGSWSSNNTAAATVNATTGVVTGVAAGSATITYTVSSTCGSNEASANITISAVPDAGAISGSSAICAGSITTLTSNGTGGGSWSSNNNLVATVNSSTGLVTGVGAGSATITYTVTNTCGIATATENITINPLPNSGIVSGAATLCAGTTAAFTTTGNGGGSWSSSNTAIATVDAVTGAVTGVAAGSVTISYTATSFSCGSSVSSANITINPSPNPGTVSGSSAVCAGSTTAFTSDGAINGSWSSDNTSVASVDANGVVTGVAAGTTTITYTVTNGCGTLGVTKVITVNPLANAGTVSGAATVCAGGATTTFTSDGLSGGVWSSDNISAATVDAASGLVTSVSAGNANIIYTVTTPCGTATASTSVTVIILPNAGTINGSSTVCAGSSVSYTSDGLSGGTWSSGTPTVATVDATTGVVTGVSAGNATITYTFTNSCGTNSATQVITINALPGAGTVTGAATVCIGGQATYSSDGLSGGSWSSSNTTAATVDAVTGVVTGHVAGTTTITYTSNTPCGTTTASSDITVVPNPDAGTVSGNNTVCVGATTNYISSGMSGGAWSSVTPSVATVDAISGVVTGVSAGNATITYTFTNSCGSPSASKMITVDLLSNAGTVSGAATVCSGSQATFTSSGLSGGAWSTSDAAVASVNPATGVVNGVATGNAIITYTSSTPCGTQTATANITVNPVLSAGTVSGSSTVCIGSTTPYTSTGSAGGTWSSVTPSVASVNATTGVVSGVSTGNATITYTVSSGCGTFSSSKMIAVSLAANPGSLSGPSSVCTGSSVTFTRSGGAGGGTWSSSNTSVATVNGSGIVTGTGSGTAVISYSVTSSCGMNSITKSITVNSALTLTVTNINASTDPNDCSALITLGANVTTTGTPLTLEYRIGFFWFSFPISSTHRFYRGTTPVTVRATNSCGTITRLFLVTVTDNQPPSITCKPGATRSANGHSSRYSVHGHEFDATASDGCGVASLVYSLSGATVDGFDNNNRSLNNVKFNVGTTTITWKATDVNGNVSTCSTVVTVNSGNNYRSGDTGNPTVPANSNPKLAMLNSTPLKVKVAPNPTSFYFTLGFQSSSNEKIRLTVTDIVGKIIEQRSDVPANSTIQLGARYRFGVYIAEIVQGKERVTLRLIKGRQ